MKKEHKKSRYYGDTYGEEYEKRFKTKPYSKKRRDQVKNNLRSFMGSGVNVDTEFLEEVEEFDETK
jgi:hypothetical protein